MIGAGLAGRVAEARARAAALPVVPALCAEPIRREEREA
ncbi:hypothetical protein FHU33_1250 [Blastococcus colisei]|uniref:Uncharacterized protein n=1 Tax=Blastococcus colisei TaxID=1564162 RepID=A0A543PCQ7_9ACTN|nr:hypothetical protein FHU33_1250 [Blastococcus colisei]